MYLATLSLRSFTLQELAEEAQSLAASSQAETAVKLRELEEAQKKIAELQAKLANLEKSRVPSIEVRNIAAYSQYTF